MNKDRYKDYLKPWQPFSQAQLIVYCDINKLSLRQVGRAIRINTDIEGLIKVMAHLATKRYRRLK